MDKVIYKIITHCLECPYCRYAQSSSGEESYFCWENKEKELVFIANGKDIIKTSILKSCRLTDK